MENFFSGSAFTDFGKTALELNGAALDAAAEVSSVDLYASSLHPIAMSFTSCLLPIQTACSQYLDACGW